MDNIRKSRLLNWLPWLAWVPVTVAVSIGIARLLAGWVRRRAVTIPPNQLDLEAFSGLTEEEAMARRLPSKDEDRQAKSRKVRLEIWRSSTFSIFNMSMLGLAIIQWILNDILSALLTIGIMFFNIGINAIQQLYATNRVEGLLAMTKPMAATIRDGRIRSVGVDEIVVDDLLLTSAGDQFLAGGQVISGQPLVTVISTNGNSDHSSRRRPGDLIAAGSYCLDGRAIYRVTEPPSEIESARWSPVQRKSERTPLQRIIARILRVMLLLIAIFLAMLFLDMANLPFLSTILESQYRETASIFFSIAPSGLFFMIVATYAIGSARLGDYGAVVRDTRAVESLGQISVLCFSKTGALTGAMVHLELMPSENGTPLLSENLARSVLGDLVRSIRRDNVFIQAIAENFPGSPQQVQESAELLSAYGWTGVTFAGADIQGTYIIGEPDVLRPRLMHSGESKADEDEGDSGNRILALRSGFDRVMTTFRRYEELEIETSEDRSVDPQNPDQESDVYPANANSDDANDTEQDPDRNLFRRFRRRVTELTQRREENTGDPNPEEEPLHSEAQLMFAYTPEAVSLYDGPHQPQLPGDLQLIGTLHIEEALRPEAKEAVNTFADSGVAIKILSSDVSEKVINTARELGLIRDDETEKTAVSGAQLATMERAQFDSTVSETNLFYQLSPNQKSDIVDSLRNQGEQVAMVGDGAGDVSAMNEANLSLTLQGSSQAAVHTADIVILEDSFAVLPTVLERGQRIVNGMLDIIKINLVQIGYISLLIAAMIIANRRVFYYHPTQGGIIAFFTVIVPSLGLTFWASPGTLPRQYMRSRLAHFVIPAALTVFAAVLAVTLFYGRSPDTIATSQMAITHELILIGLLLVVFVQPPTRFWVGGDVFSGDWRNTYMAIVLLILFIFATYLPITQELFRLQPMSDARGYLIILAVAIVWTLAIRLVWRAPWLSRYVGVLARGLDTS